MRLRMGPLAVGLIALIAVTACDRSDNDATQETQPTSETTMDADALTDALSSEFTSAGGAFRLRYPSAWIVEETFGDGALILANQRSALDRHLEGAPPESGDLVVNVGFLPGSLFQQPQLREFEVRVDADPAEFLRSSLPVFEVAPGAVLGEIESVTLDGRAVGRVRVSDQEREGVILAFGAGDAVAGIVSTVTSPGEMARFEEVVSQITGSVVYEGDQEALYGRLLTD